MRNFQFRQSLKLPRIVPGKWLLEFQFYEEEFAELTFTIKVHLEVRPIGWHLFEFELNWMHLIRNLYEISQIYCIIHNLCCGKFDKNKMQEKIFDIHILFGVQFFFLFTLYNHQLMRGSRTSANWIFQHIYDSVFILITRRHRTIETRIESHATKGRRRTITNILCSEWIKKKKRIFKSIL